MKLYRTTVVQEHPDGSHLHDPIKNGEVIAAHTLDAAFSRALSVADYDESMDVRYVCVQFLSDVEDVKGLNL